MDRRGFFGMAVGGVAMGAAVRTWPFRVFSFPTDIQIVPEFPLWMYSPASFLTDALMAPRDDGYWELNDKFRAGMRNVTVHGPGLFTDADIAQQDWA